MNAEMSLTNAKSEVIQWFTNEQQNFDDIVYVERIEHLYWEYDDTLYETISDFACIRF